MSQEELESSLTSGDNFLEGSTLRSDKIDGYYQLIPAVKFTVCISNPEDPLQYIGKCSPLIFFEKKGIEINLNCIDYKGETYEVDEGFLGDYYNESIPADSPDSQELSEDSISYDPTLIKKLNEDHKKILGIFAEIMEAASEDNYDTVNDRLDAFSNALQLHLMTEQIKFHAYLEQVLQHSDLYQQMNKTFQDKIKIIGKKALDFIDQYEKCSWDNEKKKSFVEGMEGLGKMLMERIEMEEELYELYLPKAAYQGAI